MPGTAPSGRLRSGLGRTCATALAALLLGGALMGCAGSAADQAATREAWEARDAERARLCPGRYVNGGCAGGGGP